MPMKLWLVAKDAVGKVRQRGLRESPGWIEMKANAQAIMGLRRLLIDTLRLAYFLRPHRRIRIFTIL